MATIKGKWKWNDTMPLSAEVIVGDFNCIFGSNGITHQGMEIYLVPSNNYGYIFYYDPSQGGPPTQVWDSDNGWMNEAYKIMDFGDSDITIDDGVYDTLIANATEYIEVPEEYNTKAINLNQLKRVYDNLNDKISNMSSGESSSGIPVLTTQTVRLADLEAGIYRWEYSDENNYTKKYFIYNNNEDDAQEMFGNPVFIQVTQMTENERVFYILDIGPHAVDEGHNWLYWGGIFLDDNEGYIFSRNLYSIPDSYMEQRQIVTLSDAQTITGNKTFTGAVDFTNANVTGLPSGGGSPTFSFDSSTGILTITTNG